VRTVKSRLDRAGSQRSDGMERDQAGTAEHARAESGGLAFLS
jgi:hypothetical protein